MPADGGNERDKSRAAVEQNAPATDVVAAAVVADPDSY